MGRHRLDPNSETVRIAACVPATVKRYLARLGGNGQSAVSIGLRRLAVSRMAIKNGEPAIVLALPEYLKLAKELERYRKAERK